MEYNKPPLLCIDNSAEYAKVVCDKNPEQVELYKAGGNAITFLLREVMILSRGSCSPVLAKEALQKELDSR